MSDVEHRRQPVDDRRTAARRRRQRRRRRRIYAPAAVVVLVVVLGSVAGALATRSSGPKHVTRSSHRRAGRDEPAVFAGPDGVEARWVITENAKPGTTAWQITGTAGGIDGYADHVQATLGQKVNLYVSTTAPHYRVTAYRMGYYGGAGGRMVWQSPDEEGFAQPPCPLTSGINMVQCSWSVSLSFTVTSAWVQGDYLLKLVGDGGQQSYIPLTIWDPSSHATYLVQNSVLTWQAWNDFGGYDFYGGAAPGQTPTYDDRARVVSFDRPYAASFGSGAADFPIEEYPLVRFMEQHGLDVTYGTDITTDEDPASLLDHRVVLSLGHDEQWSLSMRDAATTALDHGVNIVFFGASPVLRKVRLQPSPLGAGRQEVNYRDPPEDPLYGVDNADVSQNQWAQPPANLPSSLLVGSTYLGYGIDDPLVVSEPSSWLFAGTGLAEGAQLPGVILADYNGYVPDGPNPPGVEILAHSPVTTNYGDSGYADTTYYTVAGSDAGVFASGTNGWIPAMAPCGAESATCVAPDLDQITANLLDVFGQGPVGQRYPSQANWQSFYPQG